MEKSLHLRRRLRLALLGMHKGQLVSLASWASLHSVFHLSGAAPMLKGWQRGLEVALLMLSLLGVCLGVQASVFRYAPHVPTQGLLAITTLTIGMALLNPLLRRQFGLTAQAQRTLPDPLYSLYLATLILIGSWNAVALAILTPFAAAVPAALRFAYRRLAYRWYHSPAAHGHVWRGGLARVIMLLREAALGAVVTFLAEVVFVIFTPLFQRLGHLSLFHAHLFAAFLATVTVLLCLSALQLARQVYSARCLETPFTPSGALAPDQQRAQLPASASAKAPSLASAWRASRANVRRYLASPMFRYQALLLCVCPLLPLVEIIDDVEAELAWALFLAPLCAVYYLALLGLSLQQRTNQLQQTVEALSVSRQRQAELQGYAALITQAQEDERRRLARELHDDTAQALVALARGLDTLQVGQAPRQGPNASPDAHSQPDELRREEDAHFIAELGRMARRALESVRRACRDLRPSVLDDLGLAAALEALCANMNQRGLPTEYVLSGDEHAYPPTVEVAVYRIAQESLTNAYRHGQPTLARLAMRYESNRLHVEITDNGRGFNPQASTHMPTPTAWRNGKALDTKQAKSAKLPGEVADPHDIGAQTTTRSGLGVLGMRERAALIGATLNIQSARGQGTSVTLDVALPPD